MSDKKIVIEGITEEGEKFRPGDWAERMSGSLCTFRNRRITYSPLLQPSVKDGNQCMLLDPELRDTNPSLYESIMLFVEQNHLRVCDLDDKPKDKPEDKNKDK